MSQWQENLNFHSGRSIDENLPVSKEGYYNPTAHALKISGVQLPASIYTMYLFMKSHYRQLGIVMNRISKMIPKLAYKAFLAKSTNDVLGTR